MVGEGQIHSDDANVAAVHQFRQTDRQKEVQAFLGLAGCYRKFVPYFAEIAVPTQKQQKNMF